MHGKLPGIPPNEGQVGLDLQASKYGPVFGDFNGDGALDAAVLAYCDKGGLSWPDSIEFYSHGPRWLGGLSLGDVTRAGRDSPSGRANYRMWEHDGLVGLTWHGLAAEDIQATPSLDFSANFSIHDGSVVVTDLHRYDASPFATRVIRATVTGDQRTLALLTTPNVAGSLSYIGSAFQGARFVCLGASDADRRWPKDALYAFGNGGQWPPTDDFSRGQRFCVGDTGQGQPFILGMSHENYRQWRVVDVQFPTD